LNPITETRYTLVRYVVLWTLLAAVYALVFGILAELPPWVVVADGVVFGAVTGVEGILLWNVLRYGTAASPSVNPLLTGTISLVLAAGLLFIAVSVGAETAFMWLLSESSAAAQAAAQATQASEAPQWPLPPLWSFPRTIPARSLTVAAVYVCYVLWYSSAARSEPETEDVVVPETTPSSTTGSLERITVRGTGGRIELIPIENIVFIRAEGDYVSIVTPTGRWLKEGTMKWFEGALPRDRFVRVHRSYIVSVARISRIETSGRDHTLILRDVPDSPHAHNKGGSPIRISDTGYRLLRRTLGL
jgi:hypothetical protein